MVRDRPKLNRQLVLVQEANMLSSERMLRQIVGELGPDEYLGIPVRKAHTIVIPVKKVSAEGRAAIFPAVRDELPILP